MNVSELNLNPIGNLYKSFLTILKNVTIKYSSKGEAFETKETKMNADQYLDALNQKDTFYSYIDYTRQDYLTVGLTDEKILAKALQGDTSVVPERYHLALLDIKRKRVLDTFVESNNYYRMLNGLPDINDKEFFYPASSHVVEYGVDQSIPVHNIQDYYNKIQSGKGDYLISLIEGSGYIEDLKQAHPDKKYLDFIGSNRISINTSRTAKNFQIIQLRKTNVKQSVLDSFTMIYEQCREYFVKTLYISSYRDFIEHYDNFIAMCIMIMTTQQLVMRQLSSGIYREFFDIYAVKSLYEAYDIPYNLNIDEVTQTDIVQNLNLLIQNKATNKVIYNIANLLGFTNINVYKYYLSKERKFDQFGVPIIKYTEKFNSDTGEVETVPDYEAMYDVYFQKAELSDEDFITSFNDSSNHVSYEEVTKEDPFWHEDSYLKQRVWESSYNYVESKYLSLGISYSMTEILFENVLFLKLIMNQHEDLEGLNVKLPRILENSDIPIFDVIILLLCLTSAKHNLCGEVITVPTQVISVLDYIKNTEDGDTNLDSLKFNFKYFFNPSEDENIEEINEMKETLIDYMNTEDKENTSPDNFSFNFDYYSFDNKDREKNIEVMKEILGEEDFKRFEDCVEVISYKPEGTSDEKIEALNEIFTSIKNIHKLISFYMTKTDDRKVYETLKQLYNSLFYTKEVSDVFTIIGELTGNKRTAWNYFEFLYHRNPRLYNAVFEVDLYSNYTKYIFDNKINENDYTYTDFLKDIELGKVMIDYTHIKGESSGDISVKDEKIYFYVNHIIGRLEMMVDGLEFMYLMNDTQTPLENLLMRLVRFFKSYTVDVLGLDILFVCDFKAENMLKIFEEIYYMEKNIGMDEDVRLSHSDAINNITAVFSEKDKITFRDKFYHESHLLINEMQGIINSVRLGSDVGKIEKTLEVKDNSSIGLYDTTSVSSEQITEEKIPFRDKIVGLWYE